MLCKLLGSKSRAAIIRHLFTFEKRHVFLRELSRLCGISAPVLMKELHQLTSLGLVESRKDGNRVDYYANHSHVLYEVLCTLVMQTEGVIGLLSQCLEASDLDLIVFVYGSYATGTQCATSDVDLFVIGDIGLQEVIRRIQPVYDKINCEINPFVISCSELVERIQRKDPFIMNVIRSPKMFLRGNIDEFVNLAR